MLQCLQFLDSAVSLSQSSVGHMEESFYQACQENNPSLVRELLDSDGDTPLMFCLKNNKIEMARCLINTPGVDLDTVDRDGKHLEDIARSVFL